MSENNYTGMQLCRVSDGEEVEMGPIRLGCWDTNHPDCIALCDSYGMLRYWYLGDASANSTAISSSYFRLFLSGHPIPSGDMPINPTGTWLQREWQAFSFIRHQPGRIVFLHKRSNQVYVATLPGQLCAGRDSVLVGGKVNTLGTQLVEGQHCSLSMHPGGDVLATGDSLGRVTLYDMHENEPILRISAHRGMVTALAHHFTTVASAGEDRVVRLWDSKNASLLREFFVDMHIVRCLEISICTDGPQQGAPEGVMEVSTSVHLSAGMDSGSIYVWDIQTSNCVTMMDFDSPICSLAAPSEGQLLAVGRKGSAVAFLEYPSYQCVLETPCYGDLISVLAYNKDAYRSSGCIEWQDRLLVVTDSGAMQILEPSWGQDEVAAGDDGEQRDIDTTKERGGKEAAFGYEDIVDETEPAGEATDIMVEPKLEATPPLPPDQVTTHSMTRQQDEFLAKPRPTANPQPIAKPVKRVSGKSQVKKHAEVVANSRNMKDSMGSKKVNESLVEPSGPYGDPKRFNAVLQEYMLEQDGVLPRAVPQSELVAPAFNSTKKLMRHIKHVQAEQFPENILKKELQKGTPKEWAREDGKAVDLPMNESKYKDLIPLEDDQASNQVHWRERKVGKAVDHAWMRTLRAKPSLNRLRTPALEPQSRHEALVNLPSHETASRAKMCNTTSSMTRYRTRLAQRKTAMA